MFLKSPNHKKGMNEAFFAINAHARELIVYVKFMHVPVLTNKSVLKDHAIVMNHSLNQRGLYLRIAFIMR